MLALRPWLLAIVPFPVNKFPNKLGVNGHCNILKNLPFCTFASFSVVSLTSFINKPDSSKDLTIFIISPISWFEIINVATSDPSISFWISEYVADSAAVNANDIKRLLANGLSLFSIKGNPYFSSGPKRLPKNPHDYPILCNWAFGKFILAAKLLGKALQTFETCVLVDNNLCRKLFSSLEPPTTSDEFFRVI